MKNILARGASFSCVAGLMMGFVVLIPAGAQEQAAAPEKPLTQEPSVASGSAATPGYAVAPPQGDWRGEFEAVCAITDTSQSLAREELAALIARCDKLAELIGAEQDQTVRKVYLRRLKMCRDLFAFVLESKSTGEPPASTPGP